MTQTELMAKAHKAKEVGAQVEIVGAWVWAEFPSKPPVAARELLKAEGFHWNQKREVWQFAGVPCRHSPAMTMEIKAKYGVHKLEEVAA